MNDKDCLKSFCSNVDLNVKLKPGVDYIEFNLYRKALRKVYDQSVQDYINKYGESYLVATHLAYGDFFEDIIAVAKIYRKQPMCSAPAIFINSFAYSVINILVDEIFGTVYLAYYSLSYRMLGMPLSLVSGNTAKAYYEKAINLKEAIEVAR